MPFQQTHRKQEQDCLREEVTSQSYGAIDEKTLAGGSGRNGNPDSKSLDDSPKSSSSSSVADSLPIFRCIMIIFALSFHSIFDGLAIGLQETMPHMIQLLFAICMHKLLIAFVVGLDVYTQTNSLRKVIMYMLPFSLMSPLGVVAAAFAKVNMPESAVGILSGLSAGSLLYIAFFEILFNEKKHPKLLGIIQLFAVLLGFGLMAVLQAVTEHAD
jgi:zinc transporter 1/2/3